MNKTLTIEYNSQNTTFTTLLNSLVEAGIVRIKKHDVTTAKEKARNEIESAIGEALAMADDIAENGTSGYKTLDELLEEL